MKYDLDVVHFIRDYTRYTRKKAILNREHRSGIGVQIHGAKCDHVSSSRIIFPRVDIFQLLLYGARIETRSRCNQLLQIIPGRVVIRFEPDEAFVFLRPFQEAARVRQKRSVDERQTDVILVNANLADPRADDTAASFVVITQASPADHLRCIWSN